MLFREKIQFGLIIFLFILLTLLIVHTGFYKPFIYNINNEKLENNTNYLCESYTILDDHFRGEISQEFHLKIIKYNDKTIDEKEIKKILNEAFFEFNYSFVISGNTLTVDIDSSKIYNIKDDIFLPFDTDEFIELHILPNNIKFQREVYQNAYLYGKADGIPGETPYSTSLFVRDSFLYTNVLVHEMGHVLGLLHTFEGYDIYNMGLNCDTGDKVPDTITPNNKASVGVKSCKMYLPKELEKDTTWSEEKKENAVENYMSYSPANCMKRFEEGQVEKSRKALEQNRELQKVTTNWRQKMRTIKSKYEYKEIK